MKIELIKEERFAHAPWYNIMIDGEYFIGTGMEDVAKKQYEEIKNNPKIIEKVFTILESDEIVLPLQEETEVEIKNEE